ncbi:Zn(2)-C6 fungal-type domain-containing protein [Lachancea thermotolerans]
MGERENESFGPRFIRTLGSQSISVINPLSSQPSSISQSPAQPKANTNTQTTATASISPTASVTPSSNYRVAQACDRCRSKKTRCDGKRPQCSQCAAVGFECKVSDKLSRRAFPRGYTETLEERVRELEAENRRLVALCDLKDEQMHLVYKYSSNKRPEPSSTEEEQMLEQLSSSNGGSLRVSSTNLYLLNKTSPAGHEVPENHKCQGIDCNHTSHPHLHEKPVSTTLSDPTTISFEQHEAPGLPAVKALSSMANHEYSTQLACLVALSVPRSTEEILFIPQLLARLGQVHGLTSKQCLYTASLLASLKEPSQAVVPTTDGLTELKCTSLWEIDDPMRFFKDSCKFNLGSDNDVELLSISEIEDLISIYFEECHALIPVLNENEFYKYYNKFKESLTVDPNFFGKANSSFAHRSKSISYKIFACILLVVCQLGIMSKVKREQLPAKSKFSRIMAYYNNAILALKLNPYFSVKTTSVKTLQLMSLLLFYFLNVGEVSSVYELRGTIVSMAQQLRLHRCPSAVLGTEGSTMSKSEQGDRRLLFWGIYYLDVFSALQLGVPRLLKDHEIECALPISENGHPGVSLADQVIRLEGQVSEFSLSLLRFSKILGNILDSIFKRGMTSSIAQQVALIHENALDSWRRGLPKNLTFELDVNGTINMEELNSGSHWKKDYSMAPSCDNRTLMVLYFLVKCLVHLPVLAAKPLLGGASEVDTDATLAFDDASSGADRSSSSYVLLQQATNTFLSVQSSLKSRHLPLALNLPRIKARFALLSARGILEYTKGGALFQGNKALLLDVVKELETTKRLEIPGSLSWHSLILLDMAVSLIMQPPHTKAGKLDKLLEAKLSYYNKLMGRSANVASTKRKKEEDNTSLSNATKLTPLSSDSSSPSEKRVKLEHTDKVGETPVGVENTGQPNGNTQEHYAATWSNQNQPHSTVAEAFHLDPVLNNNPFSNGDLTAFFSTDNGMPNLSGGASMLNMVGVDQAHSAAGNDAQNTVNANSQQSTLFNDGLFRVPSNGDFLKDYYRVPGASSSQLNLMLMGSGSSGSNQRQAKQQQTNTTDPGFGFTVDASLGLAPLLAWSPEAAQEPIAETSDHDARNDSGLRRKSGAETAGVLVAGHSQLADSSTVDPASQQQRRVGSYDHTYAQDQSVEDSAITMPTRPHRGPRRRWNSTTGAAAITPNSDRPRNAPASETDENLQDLFRWQNSGF